MICPDCAEGARLMRAGELETAARMHEACPGTTWCDCQHSTNPNMRNLERITNDQVSRTT